jgi:gas vesicle protein
MSVSRFLAGFIVGGAIGAVAGVLLAPRSGEETRKMLKDTADDMARRADETAKQIKVKADDAVSDLQKRGDEIKEKLQDLIAKQKEGKAEETETHEENKEESAE